MVNRVRCRLGKKIEAKCDAKPRTVPEQRKTATTIKTSKKDDPKDFDGCLP
jgi:hypothetical protein